MHSISISYTKQNAGAELELAPDTQMELRRRLWYERYDWTRADANVTNENSGKVYTDWKPGEWLTARASWLYSERHYDNYDYQTYVGKFQWPSATCATGNCNTISSNAMRQFYLNNRERNKGQFSIAMDVLPRLHSHADFGVPG